MNHLHLIVPAMFLPQEAAQKVHAGLKLAHLEKMLRRAEQSTLAAMTVEQVLCSNFAADSVAPVRALADGLDVSEGFWLCADPAHLQLQQSQVVLQPDVECSAEEAAQLCESLNQYFAQDGLTFFAPHAQRWYVCTKEKQDVSMTPLRSAAGRDVKSLLPQGVDARRWKSLANEMQMLLHNHPLNQSRMESGQKVINCLWLWGGGTKPFLQAQVDVIGGDDGLGSSFARAAGVPYASSLTEMLDGQGKWGLWLEASLGAALQRGDLYAWHDAMQRFEDETASLIWQALNKGALQTLRLDVLSASATQRFVLDRAGCWKLWRSTRPLAIYSV